MIREFIYKYYIDPIRYGQAYNPVDTLTYAVILIIALYGVYRWLRYAKIPVDGRFVIATSANRGSDSRPLLFTASTVQR